MNNIRELLGRYSAPILFLLLQVASLSMLFRFNRYHESIFLSLYNEFAGAVNARYDGITTYFSLRRQNEELLAQNTLLLNRLRSDFERPDTSEAAAPEILPESDRRFRFLPAKVIGNSVASRKNYIMLHRGADQGVAVNMAVVSPSGVVGTVVNTSANMCIVMSLLHLQSKVVAVLKKGSGFGEVTWDGRDPRFLSLTKVPKNVAVSRGDTVVTSRYSDKFPPDYVIGYVDSVTEDQVTSTYNLRVRSSVDFTSLQYAFVVANLQAAEMEALRKSIQEVNE
jgi:rod shape-determining protein MreC